MSSPIKPKSRVAIVAGVRTPFVRIGTILRNASAIDLGVGPVNALVEKFNLASDPNGLLTFGSVIPHSDVSNIAREIAIESKLHPQTRSFSSIKACATSLATVAEAALWINRGSVPWAIAGGSESMSNFPVSFSQRFGSFLGDLQFAKSTGQKLAALAKLRPSDFAPKIPPVAERSTGLSMGQHCELMAQEWKIPRQAQDEWAVRTHQRSGEHEAWHKRFLVSAPRIQRASTTSRAEGAARQNDAQSAPLLKDNLIRKDTTLDRVSKLKPAFDKNGTITAASSSPLTDGGAAVLLADVDFAKKQGWPILAIFEDFESSAVDIKKEGLLMAPPYAILRLLQRHQTTLDAFDCVEIHEAFAAQVLCNLAALQNQEWCQSRVGLAPTKIPSIDRINPRGGSIPLGHPFGATGARLVASLATHLSETGQNSGLISICAAGGLGMIATLRKAE